MASSSIHKKCAGDNVCEQGAITNCEGCAKVFCLKHFNDHHRSLGEQLKPIINECDQLKKTINQRIMRPNFHSLIKEIDEWEKKSIKIIEERATELRQVVRQPTAVHTKELSKNLEELTEQLKQQREKNNFIETDIGYWKQKLEALKMELTSPSRIYIHRYDNDSFVKNISFIMFKKATELFEQVSDDSVKINENRQVAVCNGTGNCTEIRGKNEYMSGCHEICLGFEQVSNSWTFLGVNSKSTAVQKASYNCKSTYGWSCDNCIWSNGQYKFNQSKPRIEIQNNDPISLLFDCDNHTIAMLNKRTNARHRMDVDIGNCPLPWQVHVILCEPNSLVRIVSE